MPSITTWRRLEPRARESDVQIGLQARVHDPLWLLARQWQVGEFRGEDAGSPVVSRLEADSFGLTRYLPRALPASGTATGQPLDSRTTPLETIVEREPVVRSGGVNMRVAADAGQHFRHLLVAAGLGQYVPAYLARFAFQPLGADADADSLRFANLMKGRVLDGARLFDALRAGNFPNPGLPGLSADAAVSSSDREKAVTVAQQWRAWYQALLSEPIDTQTPWVPERMEYEFAVSAATPNGEIVLNAAEYVEGRLDWYDFSLRQGASLGSASSEARYADIRQGTVPSPVSFPGMPANRWWEFEDRQVDFGSVSVEPDDLVSLVMVEFALIYGNDWFIVPVELDIGSLTRVRSLKVVDSFGEVITIPPVTPPTAPAGAWRMFSLSADPRHASSGAVPNDYLFLPPALGPSLHGQPVEEVLLMRDEMANLAWAIERIVENRAGEPVDRRDTYRQQRSEAEAEAAPPAGTYRLTTEVPDYWIPLVPVRQPNEQGIRLQRGALARPGPQGPARPQGRIMATPGPLLLFDEEVPRSGARISAAYQYARWIDGSTHVWRGRRKDTGRGEGASGLQYDVVT
jgi:hypothetical protein